MRINFLLFCLFGFLIICGCENKKPTKKVVQIIEAELEEVIGPVTCNLLQMDFKLGGFSRSITFSYQDGLILEGRMTTPENDSVQVLSYVHEDGNLVQFSLNVGPKQLEGQYEYANDTLRSFTSGPTQVFLTYDSLGQIIQDSSRFKKRTYAYNAEGLPIKASVFDNQGEEIEQIVVTYDEQINPFKGKSTFVNMLEVLIGYPMANQIQNITSIRTTYLKKSKYRINGVYKKEGEVAETIFEYEYNEYGYPTTIRVSSTKEDDTMVLAYECN